MNIVTMVSFTFDPPSDAPAWGVAMVEAFKQCVTSICTEIQTMNNNLESKFDAMSQLVKDVKSAEKMASSAMDIALAFESNIKNLQQDMSELKLKYKGLDTAYTALQNKCSKRDCYSRRDNLVLRGELEDREEDAVKCVKVACKFFVEHLNIPENVANAMIFVRCHRLGTSKNANGHVNRKRPIIVRFHYFHDRTNVWNQRSQLKDTPYFITENFSDEVEYNRRIFYPIVSAAKKSDKFDKVYLNYDVLTIDGTQYTIENIAELPAELQPHNFSYKENNSCVIFGGIHSKYNYLSNYYDHEVVDKYRHLSFPSLEHAYQHTKACRFKDTASADAILSARSPADAKRLGSKIKGFKAANWKNSREEVMTNLLKQKFAPGTPLAEKLKATAGKTLAEAGLSDTYSIGLQLHSKDVFDSTKWKQNLLGKILMKIRDELLNKH